MNPGSTGSTLTDGIVHKPEAKKDNAQGDIKSLCAFDGIATGHGTGHIAAGNGQFRAIFALHVYSHLSRLFVTHYNTTIRKVNTMLL